ncbi:hypothetical protein CVT24_006072 [Panaeolus cyanescens]|uniref:Amino-acid acetyltransferase, mitochondrial n=1 Tax=Panaeolus cyanescens TaxID=181874 RepID=A0A409V8Q8_9AGAR|nr:hypothetical protein CVT24_006072 [Panaeolus cyanescens]
MLSTELWLQIFDFLDGKSLVRCMQTSHAMKDLICHTSSLKYKIALHKACLIDGPTHDLGDIDASSSTRLQVLSEHQKAWKTLSWRQEMNITMTRAGLWELFAGVFAQNTIDGGFEFHQLPSQLRSIQYETWTVNGGFDFTVRDFGMDPTQDLLVLIESPPLQAQGRQYILHLRNIRDGKPHARARLTDLHAPPNSILERTRSFAIQVSGDYIGVLAISINGRGLTIWNWKTGSVKLATQGSQLKSFTFFSANLVMVANVAGDGSDNGALDLLDFFDSAVDSIEQACEYSEIRPIVQLQYPACHDNVNLHYLEIRSDPSPNWKESHAVPFSVDPSNTLYIMRMWMVARRGSGSLFHFVPSSVLSSFVERGGIIPWLEWGPTKTMIGVPSTAPSDTWVCFVHGWKYVAGQMENQGQQGFSGYCCDFSPKVSTESEPEGSVDFEEEGKPEPWRDPSVFPFDALFDQPIGKHIPHRIKRFHLPDSHTHCEVMCSEDSIIVVDQTLKLEEKNATEHEAYCYLVLAIQILESILRVEVSTATFCQLGIYTLYPAVCHHPDTKIMAATLPIEVLLRILEVLDTRSLLRCMRVSSSVKKLIAQTTSLQLKIELTKARLREGPRLGDDESSASSSRLERLKKHQHAWKNFKWSREITIPIQRGGLWELYGGVLAQNTQDDTFIFHQLPSDLRSIPHETWQIETNFGFRVRDFGMDPAQDLFVLIEKPSSSGAQFKVHLRSLKDGRVHPSALTSPIHIPPRQTSARPSSFSIQVAGDYLGVLALSGAHGNELTIWEWKTGKVKLNTYGQGLKAFSFLSKEVVILATLRPSHRKAALELVNFQTAGSERSAVCDIEEKVGLQYPSFVGDSILFEDLEVRNDPGPLWQEAKAVPFCHDPEESMYVMTMWIVVDGDLGCLLHFIPSSVMTSLSQRSGKVLWKDWGLESTMITAPQGLNSLNWVCYVHGWKYVIEKPRSSETTGFTAYYCDFRPQYEQGAEGQEQAPIVRGQKVGIWSEPELVSLGNLFREPIGTRIPYVAQEFHLADVHAHCDVMCAEDNIVIVDNSRTKHSIPEPLDDHRPPDHDFIMSILRANPSLRDTRSYLNSFGLRPQTKQAPVLEPKSLPLQPATDPTRSAPTTSTTTAELPKPSPVIASILNPVYHRTALVKLQGPFTDKQLDSITRGLVYLQKLGLVSVIVVENDDLPRGDHEERPALIDEINRVVTHLEKQGARARPVVGAVVRLGPKPEDTDDAALHFDFEPPETHIIPSDLTPIRSALNAGEIPVIAPFALDSFCRSVRVDANDVIAGLVRGMVEVSSLDKSSKPAPAEGVLDFSTDIDLTPLRLMIINREGGVPSYARSGYPHLLINLTSEFDHIHETFNENWRHSNPTALSNLALARTCLAYMPTSSSAIMVSHKSPSSLIGNLITNKPAVSSSLPHALLQGNRSITPHTPTLLRRGLPIQVFRSVADIDKDKLNNLLEQSFNRVLDKKAFYERLEKDLDFVIVAGDYAGAAIVTNEPSSTSSTPISYLDKFAVLPNHQGDGTVDFLWVALHDESYGLGHPFSANPNGGKGGVGEGRDLVWRSRSNNPVNKWYFERSSGHVRLGDWVLFWCDGEKRLKIEQGRRGSDGLSYVEEWEKGRLADWAKVVAKIPSSWK